MMIVLSLSCVPKKIRGDLTKWLLEVDTGIYIGNLNPRVRDGLWRRVCENIGNGKAVMVFSVNNEQKIDFRLYNSKWSVVDFDGIKLVKKPLPVSKKKTKVASKAAPVGSYVPSGGKQKNDKQKKLDGFPTKNYTILDLETTGLSSCNAEIIEIGMVKVINGSLDDTFSCFVRNNKPVPEFITTLTGIDDSTLANQGVDILEAMQRFLAFVGILPIVCFSANFDKAFIDKAATDANIDVSNLKYFNAHSMLKSKILGLEDYKLVTIAKKLGVSSDQKHRALADSLMLYEILSKLNENLTSKM